MADLKVHGAGVIRRDGGRVNSRTGTAGYKVPQFVGLGVIGARWEVRPLPGVGIWGIPYHGFHPRLLKRGVPFGNPAET